MIEPRRDAYGPEADTSNLADYLELLALADTPLRRAELADYLEDQQWGIRSRELYHDPSLDQRDLDDNEEGGAGISPADEGADEVFSLVQARQETLGDLYPFILADESELKVKDHVDDRHQPYLCLLAITVAHHYEVQVEVMPERVFEDVVARVMRSRGLITTDTGSAARQVGNFSQLLERVGEELGLAAAPNAAIRRTRANEEGVDTVSHFSWGDKRAGHWIFIGQATCAMSNQWTKKIQEPAPPKWGPWLGCVVTPSAYLAVPHHVEDAHLLDLTQQANRMVLDRLRLAQHLGPLSDDQRSLLSAVADEGVFHPLR